MSRLQCQIPSSNIGMPPTPLSPPSVARNQEGGERRKKLTCYISQQDGHLFQWVAGPRPPAAPVPSGKGGPPGQSLGQAAATWSDLDRAVSMVIVRRMGFPRCLRGRGQTKSSSAVSTHRRKAAVGPGVRA